MSSTVVETCDAVVGGTGSLSFTLPRHPAWHVQDAEDEPADKHEVHNEEHLEVWRDHEGQHEQQQGGVSDGQCCQQQGPQQSPHTPFRSAHTAQDCH